MSQHTNDLQLSDKWICQGSNNRYPSISLSLKTGGEAHIIFNWLWKSASRIRHKIFLWLLLHDRVNTRNLLKRKYMHLDCYDCVFCNEGVEETSLHLFWDCPFAQDCWETMIPSRQRGTSTYDDILLVHHKLPKPIAMDIIILGCWNIWNQRNGKIFSYLLQCTQIQTKFQCCTFGIILFHGQH